MILNKCTLTIILTVIATGLITSLVFLSQGKTADIASSTDTLVSFPGLINSDDQSTQAPAGSSFLFAKIDNIEVAGGKTSADLNLVENIQGKDSQEQAAFVDGACTLDQIENDTCLNNPFYFHKTGKALTLPISKSADIQIYAREPNGGMLVDNSGNIYLQKIVTQKLSDDFNSNKLDSNTLYTIVTKRGLIIGIKEQYIP